MSDAVPVGIAHDLADEAPGWPALLPARPSAPHAIPPRSLAVLRWIAAQGAPRSAQIRRRFAYLSVPAHLSYLRGLGLIQRPDVELGYTATKRGHAVAERGHL